MKIFGTGMQRTGTTSLARGLRLLGIKTRDCPKELYRDIDDEVVREFDAFTDNPVPLLYQELSQRHPGAKFIHTERDESKWLPSVEWLFTVGAVKFSWDKHPEFREIHEDLYGTAEFDSDVFLQRYRSHNKEVREFFADRPDDLLIIDLSRGQGYETICPFLGIPTPDVQFPHSNRKEGLWTIRAKKFVHRFLRRGGAHR